MYENELEINQYNYKSLDINIKLYLIYYEYYLTAFIINFN